MKNSIKYFGFLLLGASALASCSDKFLEEKQNYDEVGQDVYNYYVGAKGRINDLYGWCLPNAVDMTWQYPSAGGNDEAGKSTEEYTGFSKFLNGENAPMQSATSTNQVVDYFGGGDMGNVQAAVYGAIRNINNAIAGVEGGTLTQEQKNELLGQAYFFRAWCFYKLVKWYGGVPIVRTVLDPNPSAFTQRSSAKDCFEFIIDDLDKSAELLAPFTTNGGWESSDDYGRVTSGTALALKGRVLTLWCSPLFNRAKDQERIQEAYETMKADMTTINACGYGLYGEGNPGVNASTFANMFATSVKNPEAVFVTLFNTVTDFSGTGDAVKNNRWERVIRPANTGGGGLSASQMMVDLFPMSDGKAPATYTAYSKLQNSSITYDHQYPFMDRDPRFYRTFAFPGFRWAYNGDATAMDSHNPSYNKGADYVLWNYNWFYNGDILDENNTSYRGADNISKGAGAMVRKKSDDADVNTPVYDYRPDGQGAKEGGYSVPFISAAPLMELRYAEVLLNYAEVACLAGHTDEAYTILKRIRQRAGYTGDCGLTVSSDEATCMSAILYERQIEFAYEGKRFDDMRRWMLFDGGAELPQGAPQSWLPSGWGGNTCTWLGFKPFNGQRRESFMYQVNRENVDDYDIKPARQDYDKDPLVEYLVDNDWKRPDGVDLRKDLTQQLIDLKKFYQKYLVYTERPGDDRNDDYTKRYIKFLPKYYFLGFSQGVSAHNIGLLQTIGWEDYNNGTALGTFDPLAE